MWTGVKWSKAEENNVKKINKKGAVLSNRVKSTALLFYVVPLEIGQKEFGVNIQPLHRIKPSVKEPTENGAFILRITPTSARPDSFINTDDYGLKGTPKLSGGEAVRLERNIRRSAN